MLRLRGRLNVCCAADCALWWAWGLCSPRFSTYYYLGGLSAGPIEGSPTRQLEGSPKDINYYITGNYQSICSFCTDGQPSESNDAGHFLRQGTRIYGGVAGDLGYRKSVSGRVTPPFLRNSSIGTRSRAVSAGPDRASHPLTSVLGRQGSRDQRRRGCSV